MVSLMLTSTTAEPVICDAILLMWRHYNEIFTVHSSKRPSLNLEKRTSGTDEVCIVGRTTFHQSLVTCRIFLVDNQFDGSNRSECHWNENVVILMKFSSLAALEVVILTTFSAASDENFIKMKTFPFQWSHQTLTFAEPRYSQTVTDLDKDSTLFKIQDPLLSTDFNFNPVWINNYTHYKVCDVITYPS